jgi:hypothetical protein
LSFGRLAVRRPSFGAVAQLVAHHTGSVGVRGSSPLSSTQKHWPRATCKIINFDLVAILVAIGATGGLGHGSQK